MTEIVIKPQHLSPEELPINEWYFCKDRKTREMRVVVRGKASYCGISDPVFFMDVDGGLCYNNYGYFKSVYYIIGPVNKIEVS